MAGVPRFDLDPRERPALLRAFQFLEVDDDREVGYDAIGQAPMFQGRE